MEKKLFIITNRKLIKKGSLTDIIKGAVNGGADAIILREKDLNYKELYTLAKNIKEVIENRVPLIINGNLEVAQNVAASGVQFSFNNFIKLHAAYEGIKGVSIHSLEEGIVVQKLGAAYALAGHIFNTACKPGLDGRGTDFLKDLCKNLSIPVIAIGGIELSNIGSVLKAGAAGAAVMSSVMEADEPEKIVYKLKQRIFHSGELRIES